jgi:conjugal transfer ATP-binding protein TraC
LKLKLIDRGVRTSPASSMIHLETYTTEDRLIVSKPDGDKLMIGRAIEASALIAGGGDFGMTVNAVIRSAPDNSVVQVSLIGSPDFDGPARYVTGKDQGSRAVSELVQRHRGVLERALEVGWQEEEPVLSTRRVLISLAVPVADTSPTTLSEAAIKQADFLANVKRSGFRDAQVLSASDVVGVYRWFFNIFKQRVPSWTSWSICAFRSLAPTRNSTSAMNMLASSVTTATAQPWPSRAFPKSRAPA